MAQLPSPSPASPFTRALAVGIGVVAVAALFWVPQDGEVPYVDGPALPGLAAGLDGSTTGSGGWVIDLVDDASAAQVAAVEAALGAPLTLAGPDAADAGLYTVTLSATPALAEPNPLGIEAIEREQLYTADDLPAGPVSLLGYPNDPGAAGQWNLARIGAPTGWRAGGGRGVIVAVIDTGVSPSDELLNVLPGKSFVPGTGSAADDHGHGTHVAGTIAQATNNGLGVAGIAPNATILPLKVLSASGSGQTSWIAAAIDDAADQGAQVINLSLGGGHSDVLVKAVERARARGVIVVAAAGRPPRTTPARRRSVSGPGRPGRRAGGSWRLRRRPRRRDARAR